MCGCTPIVVPEEGRSREDWFPNPSDRYGLAYGWDDVDAAVATRGPLLDKLARTREAEDDMLRAFVTETQSFFS